MLFSRVLMSILSTTSIGAGKVKRSPDKGAEAACYDHTEEMVWRHLNVFERKCEIGRRLPRARYIKTQKVYPLCPSTTSL